MGDKRQYIIEKTAHQLVLKVTTYSNFNIDDIATQCCISKKTIYKYFENKQALLEESYAFLQKKLINNIHSKAKDINNSSLLNEIIGEVYKMLCIYTLMHKKVPDFYIKFEKEISKIYKLINTVFLKTS